MRGGRPGVHAEMRLGVRHSPAREETLHLTAICRERAPAIGGDAGQNLFERHVQPHRETVSVDRRAVFRIGECSAACGDDDVAKWEKQTEDLALDRPKVQFSVARENVGNSPSLPRFDQLVDVLGPPAEPLGQRARDRGLAGSHESYEINLIGGHRA